MARVLIVDDTDIVRKALELAVRKMGHDAESTSDAGVALELARLHRPDLALLDYRMPGMDGATLFGEMQRELGANCPKVLFVSATPPRRGTRQGRGGQRRAAGGLREEALPSRRPVEAGGRGPGGVEAGTASPPRRRSPPSASGRPTRR